MHSVLLLSPFYRQETEWVLLAQNHTSNKSQNLKSRLIWFPSSCSEPLCPLFLLFPASQNYVEQKSRNPEIVCQMLHAHFSERGSMAYVYVLKVSASIMV